MARGRERETTKFSTVDDAGETTDVYLNPPPPPSESPVVVVPPRLAHPRLIARPASLALGTRAMPTPAAAGPDFVEEVATERLS